jgi:hypothetical protein
MRRTFSYSLILFAGPLLAQTNNTKGAPNPSKSATVEAVREYVLGYTKSLPNYTCTITTRHVKSPVGIGQASGAVEMTKIEEQLNFVGGKELRKIIRIDGRPATEDDADQQKETSEGEFGALLDVIFEPATGADIQWDRSATLNKRKVDVIAFHVPQRLGYVLNGSSGSVRVPFEGFVFADAQTHAVMRLEMKCTMVPVKFQMQLFDLTLDYKAASVAGREVILPSHFSLHYRDFADDHNHTNDGQYSAYLQFSADATLQFGDANQ